MDGQIAAFVAGVITAGLLVAAGFFVSFWKRTKDRLFLVFAAAFCLMALNQGLPIVYGIAAEERSNFYLLRAAAFVLIIVGVLMKNVGRSPRN